MNGPHKKYHDLMVDALFGEIDPEDERRLEKHLSTCDACAEEFESLQATLQVTAQRERPEMPPAYWQSYRARLEQRMEREAEASAPAASFGERLREWWQSLPAVLPQTGPQWALQGAMVAAVLLVGLWIGAPQDDPVAPVDTPLPTASSTSGMSNLLLARQPVQSDFGTVRPSIAGVEDITYDVTNGTVEIRYNTVNDIVVRGRPDDPGIQRLLQRALLDERNPSSRLHAVKTIESASVQPDDEIVRALRYLAREEADPGMRLRAVRALRSLHKQRPLAADTRDVLVGIVLNAEHTPLRIEALQALTENAQPASDDAPGYLYQVRNDSNTYLRYQAEQLLQQASVQRVQPLGSPSREPDVP